MNSPRSILFIAFLVVSFFLYQNWVVESAPGTTAPTNSESTQQQAADSAGSTDVPSGSVAASNDVPEAEGVPKTSSATTIHVETDVLDVQIDTRGGDIVSAKLLQFAKELDSDKRFQLLQNESNAVYIAQSGLIGADGIDNKNGRAVYSYEKTDYSSTSEKIEVPLTYTSENGVVYRKIFTFTPGHYDIDVRFEIENNSADTLSTQFYGQLKRSMGTGESGSMIMPTYFGAAYSHDDDKFEKYDFEDMQDKRLDVTSQTGWVSMLEHYFVSAWIPTQQQTNRLFSRVANGSQAIIGVVYPATQVNPNSTETIESKLYLGPKDQDSMAQLVEHLDLTVDYGFLWWLAQPIFKLLQFLQSIVINWGLAIILTTVIVKALLFPLTKAQYVSMAKMRMLQPKMTELRERYNSDRQKLSQEMMKLYKTEKVNPLGGCLPMLLQLPIFLALYWVLLESVELRHSEFIFWIQDLSTKDPYYILPILMGASMFLMQRLQPTPATDPMQQKLFQYMPVVFTVFFLWFPSGLVLYWLVSNLITIAQMLIIYRGLEKKGMMVRGNKKK
ncbi:membrane protein insertase YidC [Idiomarina sp. UBA4520]|mgnify:FL=1|jgi:YidC/Oxa1 family membrane protein insertase|uniref:membrane protein insertase YidC n=1 Tax=Idiomarina sp. UBA4520 TaxID=1946647 RepID=UPI000AD20BB9|nr:MULTISPECIES: membrane protein insertase YidC [unclassified Idiomarina]|tara:strand:- start:15051 stop:16721 length:1671 start_codon:yes stop_codon:yes gene_type:complete